jgi:hypothetical protein
VGTQKLQKQIKTKKERIYIFMMKEKEMGAEELVLEPPTELIEEAKAIAQNTKSDEKFSFVLQYDVNQKEFLLSILQTVGAIVEKDNEEGHTLFVTMNMTQLAFIKRLDCVERVKTDEGINSLLAEEAVTSEPLTVTADGNATPVQAKATAQITTEEEISEDSITVQAVAASARCCCGSCSTNTSMQTAQTISDESETSGNIGCPRGEQWFKFTATRTGQYTIYTKGYEDTIGTLYDCCGNQIIEIDDYAPCGALNFRMIIDLTAGSTYYVKVRLCGEHTGNYTLRVTEQVLANSVSINKTTINLVKDVTYELPVTPNYTYKGYNGAQRIEGLSVTISPSNTSEQKIWWNGVNDNVFELLYGWDDDGDRYIHLKATGLGTAQLCARDWNTNGKADKCEVAVKYWPVYDKPSIHSRESWDARDVVSDRLVPRERNPQKIVFHHTADKFSSTDTADIIAEIKETQNEHIDNREKCDISYHFVIDPSGGIWQGAMVDEHQRGHATGHFDDIGVVLLGDFESRWQNLGFPNTLNDNQKNAMKELSKWLCYEYNLPIDKSNNLSPITTHKAASGGTECPGDNAEHWIENDLKDYMNDWHP